jgi:hypothetical protein
MRRPCDLFNEYRDGTLNSEERKEYESHLLACGVCRGNWLLLNNLARVIRNQELPEPKLLPSQVAARAYERLGSWDLCLLSWMKPATAWAGLAFLAVVLSLLWAVPAAQQTNAYSEYETLMNRIDTNSTGTNASATMTDDALELWLEQGGTIQ